MKGQYPVEAIAALLRHARHAVAFTGAGISTASGIPDFRSPETGVWAHIDPGAVSLDGFRQNPGRFFEWVSPLIDCVMLAEPNAAHHALVTLERQKHLQAVITQNIDMLHTRAGSKNVYELHGHLREGTCSHCFAQFPGAPLWMQFMHDRQIPRCPFCAGVIKPNVILFGEQLPYLPYRQSIAAAQNADIILIIGSSLEVAPASDVPLIAQQHGARIFIINREPTPFDSLATGVIHGNAETVLPQILRAMESS